MIPHSQCSTSEASSLLLPSPPTPVREQIARVVFSAAQTAFKVENARFLNEGVCCDFTTNKGITALTQTPAATTAETLAKAG